MGGFGILKLYMKFWWPLFLAMKFTFLFLNLGKIKIYIPTSTEGVGGLPVEELFLKKTALFFSASLIRHHQSKHNQRQGQR